jgi:hypothetical protein
MKIKYYSSNNLFLVDEAVAHALDGTDYEQGRLEDMEKSIEKIRVFMGRFIVLQLESQNITPEQVMRLLGPLYKEIKDEN